MRLTSLANNASYNAGRFETQSVGELRERVKEAGSKGRLRVRNELGDIGSILAMRDNRLATFQVASQFNCLEMPGPSVTPEEGVTGYVRDRSGGRGRGFLDGPQRGGAGSGGGPLGQIMMLGRLCVCM